MDIQTYKGRKSEHEYKASESCKLVKSSKTHFWNRFYSDPERFVKLPSIPSASLPYSPLDRSPSEFE